MGKIQIGKKDLIWVYLSRVMAFGINLILLPLIMRFLGAEELGLWYVFASISQIVNLFDFGFSSTISRHMTYAWSGAKQLEKTSVAKEYDNKINVDLVSEIIVTCRIVYFFISAIGLLIMSTFGTAYLYKVTDDGLAGNILIAWAVYVFSVFLNMFYGYWSSLLQGIGAVAERNKMGVYSKTIQIFIAIILITGGYGLLGFVISYFVSGIVVRLAGAFYFKRHIKNMPINSKFEINRVRKCFSKIWGTAWKDGVVMFAQYLSTQANTLICAYYIDLESTSVYGLMTQVVSTIASVAALYFTAYQPAFSSACLREDMIMQKQIVCVTDFVYKIIFGVGAIALFLIGMPILHWLRPEIQIGTFFILLMGAFYYFFNQKDLFASMIASFNEIPFWIHYVVTAICSIGLSIFFTKTLCWGIVGLISAQLITNLAFNCWYWPIYLMKKVDIRYKDIYTVGFAYIKDKLKYTKNSRRRNDYYGY